ncbi:MAG TPA: hypothetical protein VH062_20310, partial [Polyangiaceae bacterium]|nr:hypothetical protein [Polyangiaceae bacterium]
ALCTGMSTTGGGSILNANVSPNFNTQGQMVHNGTGQAILECPVLNLAMSAGFSTPQLNNVSGQGQDLNTSSPVQVYTTIPGQNGTVVAASGAQHATATVYGWSNAIGMYFGLCRTYSGGNGGTCGTFKLAPASSNFALTAFDYTAWTGGAVGDGYYIGALVYQNDSNGSNNDIFSYSITGT